MFSNSTGVNHNTGPAGLLTFSSRDFINLKNLAIFCLSIHECRNILTWKSQQKRFVLYSEENDESIAMKMIEHSRK